MGAARRDPRRGASPVTRGQARFQCSAPVPGMTVILTATAKNQLLPTILSRAQVITFQSPDRNAVITKLEEGGANSQLARVAGRLTGNVSEAQELLASHEFQDTVNRVFQ